MHLLIEIALLIVGVAGWLYALSRKPTDEEKKIIREYNRLPESVKDALRYKPLSGIKIAGLDDAKGTGRSIRTLLYNGAVLAPKEEADYRVKTDKGSHRGEARIKIIDQCGNCITSDDLCTSESYYNPGIDKFIAKAISSLASARYTEILQKEHAEFAKAEAKAQEELDQYTTG